jgi:hypothetical protein
MLSKVTTRDAVGLLISSLAGLLVYDDARRRDWSKDKFANRAWHWGVGAFFLVLVIVPVYLVRRRNRPLLPT